MEKNWNEYGTAVVEEKINQIDRRLKMIRYLGTGLAGYTQGGDMTKANKEVDRLEEELKEIQEVLSKRKRV